MVKRVVLVGNPNSGKTALFNALTGSHQTVGNWPGVTVERKAGNCFLEDDQCVEVVDLPGIYDASLGDSEALGVDGKITCDYLSQGTFDQIINVVDASNLERNLFLTLQLLECGVPVIVALNMMDVVKCRGLTINVDALGNILGVPIIPMVARKQQGIVALKKAMGSAVHSPIFKLPLPDVLEQSIGQLQENIDKQLGPTLSLRGRRFAVRLLEEDGQHRNISIPLRGIVHDITQRIIDTLGEEPDLLLADARYAFARSVCQEVVHHNAHDTQTTHKRGKNTVNRQGLSSKLDRVLLNRYAGIPIFLFVMYTMFVFAINFGGAFQDFFDLASSTIFVEAPAYWLTAWHAPAWLTLLVVNVGRGINTTVTFIPVIGAMFFFFGLLEDSGYMVRAAFLVDRFMRAWGLSGKSFVPMIVGFGCNVPAIMGARTLENHRDRILTVLMMPFMSCGARLAIFAVFCSAFFSTSGAQIVFLLYCTGIVLALLTGTLLRRSVLPGDPAPLVMELPNYHIPHWRSLGLQLWHRLKGFVIGAGRFIVPICAVIGFLNEISPTGTWANQKDQSALAVMGRGITPVFTPMGIQPDNWPATVGLLTGVLAKEVVIGTLNTLYREGPLEEQNENFSLRAGLMQAVESVPANLVGLGAAIVNPFVASEAPHDMEARPYGVMSKAFLGQAGAFAYLLFILIYFPCVSTMAVMRREIGMGWTLFSVLWATGLAYVLAVMVFQGLTFSAHPVQSLRWIVALSTLLGLSVWTMSSYKNPRSKVVRLFTRKSG